MENRTVLSKEFIKQTLVENRKTLRKYGVKRIGLFGSYVRGMATTGSDIDFLVELERLTFRDYIGRVVVQSIAPLPHFFHFQRYA